MLMRCSGLCRIESKPKPKLLKGEMSIVRKKRQCRRHRCQLSPDGHLVLKSTRD